MSESRIEKLRDEWRNRADSIDNRQLGTELAKIACDMRSAAEELDAAILAEKADFERDRATPSPVEGNDAVNEAYEQAAQLCDEWASSCWDSFRDQSLAVKQRAEAIRALKTRPENREPSSSSPSPSLREKVEE